MATHTNTFDIQDILSIIPNDWLRLTTHRLDIYNEAMAKKEFLAAFEALIAQNELSADNLAQLPTAFDYIRLGHPLSCLLEWQIANNNQLDPEQVISFDSITMPIMAVLRKNLMSQTATRIVYSGTNPPLNDEAKLKTVYNYQFEQVAWSGGELPSFDGTTVYVRQTDNIQQFNLEPSADVYINLHPQYGSVLLVANEDAEQGFSKEIQHVRRRETIAITPTNALAVMQQAPSMTSNTEAHKAQVQSIVQDITAGATQALISSSGLSIQYALLMAMLDHALQHNSGQAIKIIVPTNCYGGTNDQARRVAACHPLVDIVDLAVDSGSDMVQSIDTVLNQIATENGVPFIIAEIPTNPRVEVPDLAALKQVLERERTNKDGNKAAAPVFILDQTFCPNIRFIAPEHDTFSGTATIVFASGSKFPSGGKCTAGYCIGNHLAQDYMHLVEYHLNLCDNEATPAQYEILAAQMPSMLQRVQDAYVNTQRFVDFIEEVLPTAKINFVSAELVEQGFTPSVFSLDLPSIGNTPAEKEANKRARNLELINRMIQQIPDESKFCVSYGQLQGCYWTIPATSTQGTTKEGDKDYIVRVALSPDLDLEKHMEVFQGFVDSIS